MTGLYTLITETIEQHPGADADRLATAIFEQLIPEHTMLVRFHTEQNSEAYWEHGYTSSSTDIVSPVILGHQLTDRALGELYFQIEAAGTLGEADAYRDLEEHIATIGEAPAQRLLEDRTRLPL